MLINNHSIQNLADKVNGADGQANAWYFAGTASLVVASIITLTNALRKTLSIPLSYTAVAVSFAGLSATLVGAGKAARAKAFRESMEEISSIGEQTSGSSEVLSGSATDWQRIMTARAMETKRACCGK